MGDKAAKLEVELNNEVNDLEQGEEPGAGHLDTTLFVAESFEDLSNDLVLKQFDEEFQTEIEQTAVAANDGHYDDTGEETSPREVFDAPEGSPPKSPSKGQVRSPSRSPLKSRSDSTINSEEDVDGPKPAISGQVEEDVDEVRKQRAETVSEVKRDSESEDVSEPGWALHKKHVFVLSEAGKPIYTRFGNEEKLVTLMGVLQALVSFVQDNDDNIRVVCAGDHKFVFLVRGPLILVAVCYGKDSTSQLLVQLTYVYHQILSVLTFTQLTRVFEQRRNYDLRKLLSGTEKFIDNLMNLMNKDPSFLFGAVRCLPLPSSVRDTIGQTLQQAKAKDLVFAILVADNQLITMVRPKRFILHPSDLHLVFNLVSASTAFRTAESWTPICLPKFDNSGYLHAYVTYFEDSCPACLLLLSTDRNSFFELSSCKAKIKERLDRYKSLEAITKSNTKGSYTIDQTGIPDLWHFMYKSRSTAQFTSPEVGAPYVTNEERERLFGEYLYLHNRIHSSMRPLKMLCHVGQKEMLIGWVTAGFELFATFSPLTSKMTAMNAVNKLLRWIKKEEERLFIITSYTF